MVWNTCGSKSHEPLRGQARRSSFPQYVPPSCPFPQGLSTSRAERAPMTGDTKLVVSSGGALYQPVTMVTSQGQVVTQAIPQGAIQIQNTQVSVCPSVCTFAWVWGRATNQGHLPPGRHLTQVTHLLPIILLRGNITPTFQLRSWVLERFYHFLQFCCLPITSKAPVSGLELSEQRGLGRPL